MPSELVLIHHPGLRRESRQPKGTAKVMQASGWKPGPLPKAEAAEPKAEQPKAESEPTSQGGVTPPKSDTTRSRS